MLPSKLTPIRAANASAAEAIIGPAIETWCSTCWSPSHGKSLLDAIALHMGVVCDIKRQSKRPVPGGAVALHLGVVCDVNESVQR